MSVNIQPTMWRWTNGTLCHIIGLIIGGADLTTLFIKSSSKCCLINCTGNRSVGHWVKVHRRKVRKGIRTVVTGEG
jgi:hypothetical protein